MKLFFKLKILPYFLYFLVRLIYATNKKVYHHPQLKDDEAYVFVMWHGDLLSQPFNYRALRGKRVVKGMISLNKDGEILSRVFSLLGIEALRGSSSKGAAKVLISTIKEIKSGTDIAITPDGPRGPRFSVANGVVAIAQKSGSNIVVLNSKPSKYWQFKSWDKFVLPKPFGKIDFYMSEPYNINDLQMDEAKDFIKEKLMIHSIK
ncbi:lysophospholipid acyltransferase family protein [Arcobacter sp. YIC-464]|uniref:lysophospholipid acyltransferase family protein n=1 Tax=Arcobacter sp. YIC-464 TaxID=3376631 RepID=UPI003C1C049B